MYKEKKIEIIMGWDHRVSFRVLSFFVVDLLLEELVSLVISTVSRDLRFTQTGSFKNNIPGVISHLVAKISITRGAQICITLVKCYGSNHTCLVFIPIDGFSKSNHASIQITLVNRIYFTLRTSMSL